MKPAVKSTADIEILAQPSPWHGRATLRLVDFRHRRFDGAWSDRFTWELWQRGRAAAMLPYDPVGDMVAMIEQFRLPAHAAGFSGVMQEIPAGMCEPGEDPETTIRRELQEEAGIVARRMHKIGDILLSPGTSDEVVVLYAGEITAPAPEAANDRDLRSVRDASEDIRVRVRPAQAAIDEALAGGLANSVAMIGLLWLAARRDWLRAQWR